MTEQQYKSALVQFLWNSVYPQIREAAMAHPIGNMLWKSFEPEIPNYLKQLDENRELQNQIVTHLRGLMAMIEEDIGEELPYIPPVNLREARIPENLGRLPSDEEEESP